MANNLINIILVDNGSATDIFYWDAYQKTGLTESDLSPMTSFLYGFTEDHMIPIGTMKLAVTMGDQP